MLESIKFILKSLWDYITAISLIITVGVLETKQLKQYWWAVLIIYVVLLIVYYFIYKRKNKRKKRASKSLHNFNHYLRNYIADIIEDEKNSHKIFKNNCKDLCDDVHKFIETEYKKDVGITIKLLKPWDKEPKENDVLNTELCSLCRCGNKDRERTENEIINTDKPEKVSENTAFFSILLGKDESNGITKTTFACSNLLMLDKIWKINKKGEYRNPHENYIGVYRSTVVVPIRINKLSGKFKDSECYKNYKIYGFLCIDCEETFSRAAKEEMVEFVCNFADGLAALFYSKYKNNYYSEFDISREKNTAVAGVNNNEVL